MTRTLILSVDMQGAPDLQRHALQMQMADWLKVNKTVLPFENLIILPAAGETRLFWLEGTATDIKTLEEIKDRLQPVLQVALDIKIDKEGLLKRPPSRAPNEHLFRARPPTKL